jgi:hypothetical protein
MGVWPIRFFFSIPWSSCFKVRGVGRDGNHLDRVVRSWMKPFLEYGVRLLHHMQLWQAMDGKLSPSPSASASSLSSPSPSPPLLLLIEVQPESGGAARPGWCRQ